MRAKSIMPTEAQEQKVLVQWLRLRDLAGQFTASLNGAMLANAYRQVNHLKCMGMSSGFPDLMIYLPPPKAPGRVGVAIEMKRVNGGKVSPEQTLWLSFLERMGWVTMVSPGADQAIRELLRLGY